MKRKRHTPDQIVRKLREADRLLSEGKPIAFLCQRLGWQITFGIWWRLSDCSGNVISRSYPRSQHNVRIAFFHNTLAAHQRG